MADSIQATETIQGFRVADAGFDETTLCLHFDTGAMLACFLQGGVVSWEIKDSNEMKSVPCEPIYLFHFLLRDGSWSKRYESQPEMIVQSLKGLRAQALSATTTRLLIQFAKEPERAGVDLWVKPARDIQKHRDFLLLETC